MSRITVANQLEKIRAARAKLESEEKKLLSRSHDKALAQIVLIARDAALSIDQITAALESKSRSKGTKPGAKNPRKDSAVRKVAPKYRDPANPNNTWTGRGRMPRWVAALHAKGELSNALIRA